MIDVHELLRMKEEDLIRVRKEIEALRLVAPLLVDSDHAYAPQSDLSAVDSAGPANTHPIHQAHSQDESHEPQTVSASPKRSLLGWLNRAAGE